MRRIRSSGARTGSAVSRFVTLAFFIAILLITVGIYLFLQGAKAHKVLICNVSETALDRRENVAARNMLGHTYGFKAIAAGPEKILSFLSALDGYDAIWIHKTGMHDLPQSMKEKLIPALKMYLEGGGNILLTDEAFPLIYDLGLEPEKPEVRSFPVKSNGFTRVEGFHSFRGHPVFRNLFGGAFVYQPLKDTILRAWGYFDKNVPENGKTVAIRWQDIFFHDSDKVILEYHTGKGKLLAVGSAVYLSLPNDLRGHLMQFISNIFEYFVNPPERGAVVSYWEYPPLRVVQDTLNGPGIPFGEPRLWSLPEPLLQVTDRKGAGDPWDLAGTRILIMGRENGGLEEVWIHPFMALRDFEAGLIFSGDTAVHWLQKEVPEVDIRASMLERHYHFVHGELDEILVVHPHKATGVMHYEYHGDISAQLVFRFRTNLRWMWPYAQAATGGMAYAWSDSMQAFTVRDGHDQAMVIVGMNKKPLETVIGPYDAVKITGDKLIPVPGDTFRVGAAARIRLPRSGQVDVVLAGSWGNISRAPALYRRVMAAGPEVVRRDQYAWAKKFLGEATRIESPDSGWNNAYLWSLLNTRRFMVATPGVGTSLVAGYATTDRGWDGAQPVSGRPGYAWYFGRDGEWSAMAMLDDGDFDQVRKVLELYMRYQDMDGKIFHELTTSGVVHYSAADATPLFVVLAGRYLRYSGDITFIGEHREAIRKAMDYCYSTDFDHDGLIENGRVGHGWVEGGPLYGSRTTLYLASVWAEALHEAARIFHALGEEENAGAYATDYQKVSGILNHNFWNDSTRFFDHGLYPDGTFNPQPTIMPAIPFLFGQITRRGKTVPVLEQFAANGFSSDWGTRIIPENSKRFNPGSYHGGSVWPLYTGWTSLAEYRNGFPVQGFIHMSENMRIGNFWAKGAIEEVMHGTTYRPYGVCWHQCWSEIMVFMPAVEGMLGWWPDAMHHTVSLTPEFPAGWDSVSVQGLHVGDHRLGMKMRKNDSVTVFIFSHQGPGLLTVHLNYTFPVGTVIQKVSVEGKNGKYVITPEKFISEASFDIRKEARVRIRHRGGVCLVPPVPAPLPGQVSHGFRVIREQYAQRRWAVHLQGRPGSRDTVRIRAYEPVEAVEGGKLIRKKGNTLSYEIRFPESKQKYVGKKLVFQLEPERK